MPVDQDLGKRGYDALTSPDRPMTGPMELSKLNGQNNLEDCEAKKTWIQVIIGAKIHQCLTAQVPDFLSEEYKACDNDGDSLEEFWTPEDMYSKEYWSYGPSSNPNNAPDPLFMGNDSCSKDNASGVYYTYNTDSINSFSHLLYYTYDTDS